MFNTPIVFIAFNRPETTAQVWTRIRELQPRHLFVVCDGARPERSEDACRCAEVRRIVDGVDWPCEVHRNYSATNLGAARRVSSGLDWVFSEVEEAIILEDDCLPEPTFFSFCAELLALYRTDARVAQIAGCSFQPKPTKDDPSYYFSRYTHSWGWATWRRAWQHYDHSMKAWRRDRGGSWLAQCLENPAERQIWARCFDETLSGRVDAWDYRWTLAAWLEGRLSILPYRNLISNIGFGVDATHTRKGSPLAALPTVPMPFPLVHPVEFARNVTADERTSRLIFVPPALPVRLLRRMRRFLQR